MKKMGGLLEGLLLLAMGLYMSALSWVGDYGYFMNPKFKWLTATAAVGLIALGISLLVRPNRRPSISNIVAFAFLIALFAVELDAAISPPPDYANKEAGQAGADRGEPTLSYDGRDYIKINVAELSLLLQGERGANSASPFVVRGIVKKSRLLERQGEFAVIRLTVFCCLADAIAIGFRVKYDDIAALKDGDWVNVFGKLKPEPLTREALTSVQQNGKFFTALEENYLLVADHIEKIAPPEVAYIFEFEEEPPYAY